MGGCGFLGVFSLAGVHGSCAAPFCAALAMVTTVLIVTQVFVGAIMSYFSFSGFWKVLHLVLGLLSMNTAYAALYFYKHSEYVHASGSYVFRVA